MTSSSRDKSRDDDRSIQDAPTPQSLKLPRFPARGVHCFESLQSIRVSSYKDAEGGTHTSTNSYRTTLPSLDDIERSPDADLDLAEGFDSFGKVY